MSGQKTITSFGVKEGGTSLDIYDQGMWVGSVQSITYKQDTDTEAAIGMCVIDSLQTYPLEASIRVTHYGPGEHDFIEFSDVSFQDRVEIGKATVFASSKMTEGSMYNGTGEKR